MFEDSPLGGGSNVGTWSAVNDRWADQRNEAEGLHFRQQQLAHRAETHNNSLRATRRGSVDASGR